MREPTEMELKCCHAIENLWEPWNGRDTDAPSNLQVVRAVVQALREPGHDLTAAVVKPGDDRTEAVRIWQAMINAASPQQSER